MFAIGGAVSGLDTSSMISQLMQVERAPIVNYQNRQSALRREDSAWSGIVTKLSSLQKSVDDLKTSGALAATVSASSSDPDAVSATATSGARPGSLTFRVDQLATAHQTAGSGTFASDTSLVGAGTYDLTVGGETTSLVTDGGTTLADLASQIDEIDGVAAQVVKVGDGAFRLVVSSDDTGVANAHSVTTDLAGLDAGNDLQAASDATITLGTGTGAIAVTRTSNTVSDLMPGVTIDLAEAGTTPVTVTVAQDLDSAVESVKGLVDAVNGALNEVKRHTSYDAASNAGGVLLGNSVTRTLSMDLRQAVSDVVGDLTGPYTYGGSVGMSLTRTGTVEVDEIALREALSDDPEAVSRLFSRGGTPSAPGFEYVASTSSTAPGAYDVDVTTVARVASMAGATYSPPATSPETFTITAPDGSAVSVTVAIGANAAAAVNAINDALRASGVEDLTAEVTDDGAGGEAIGLATSTYGASTSFTVGANGLGITAGTYTGQDVAGTLAGVAAEGAGRVLTATSGDAEGLRVRTTGGSTGALGTLTVTSGIADRLDRVLSRYLDGDGLIPSARDSIESRIDDYDEQIEAYEERLEIRERTLRRQFTAMETSMATLSSQGGWLAAQMGGSA